jgi:hypothetical protein
VSKKLRLQKESIRALLGPELRQVHGGEGEWIAEKCVADSLVVGCVTITATDYCVNGTRNCIINPT